MVQVRRLTFQGDRAVELRTRSLRLIAVTARGPRIAFLGTPTGENLLLWSPRQYRRGAWDLMGGHRLWTARPGADESEETYRPDNAACEVELARDGFSVTAPVDPETKLQRGFRVRARGADRVELEQFATNQSDMLWSGGLWGLTCTKPTDSSSYLVPLGDGSGWDYATLVAFRTWGGGHGGHGFDDPQFAFTRDQLVLRPAGRENKRMIKADAGLLALHDPARGILFAKRAPFDPHGNYPLATNLALYVGPKNFMVEMETMGPALTLKPGESIRHVETWILRPSGPRPPSSSALRKLFR